MKEEDQTKDLKFSLERKLCFKIFDKGSLYFFLMAKDMNVKTLFKPKLRWAN